MKKYIVYPVMVVFLTQFDLKAQVNLVPNPGFEDTIACPIYGWLSTCQTWQAFSSSPDYFNNCAPGWSSYSVPDNIHGFQMASSGSAYAGVYCYVEGETDYAVDREILGNSLLNPLTIGQRYFVSFKVSLGTNTSTSGQSLAINKLGVLFSTVSYDNIDSSTIPPIGNFAHVFTDSIVSDSLGWTTIFGSFISDSNYTFLSIGNFYTISNTDTIHFNTNNPFTPSAYYFVDDVCVSTDSAFCANYLYVEVVNNDFRDQFSIFPNPGSDIVTVQVNDNGLNFLTCYNSVGQVVYTNFFERITNLNFATLPRGIYFIQVTVDDHYSVKKVIIE